MAAATFVRRPRAITVMRGQTQQRQTTAMAGNLPFAAMTRAGDQSNEKTVVKLTASGYTADSAIDRISGAYRRRLSVTQVINQMKKDRMLGIERWL